jgi:hypothetical protein
VSIAIENYLAPSYFVSYSRKQQDKALAFRDLLAGNARSVWLDQDDIALGDPWLDEIRKGIDAADELVLLLSEDSIASPIVEKEVRHAQAAGKLVRPILIAKTSIPVPDYLQHIHHIDISEVDDLVDARRRLAAYFGDTEGDPASDAVLKLRACRRIWPCFTSEFASPAGRIAAHGHATRLDRLRSNHSEASALQLNAGLMHCAAGQWDKGIALLRGYAHAANNFPGWFFLALHLLRREPARNAPVACVKEALEAVEAALQFGPNALAFLTAAVIETGGANLGDVNLERRMAAFDDAHRSGADPRGEYFRALWCLKPSFSVLREHDRRLRALIGEMSHD